MVTFVINSRDILSYSFFIFKDIQYEWYNGNYGEVSHTYGSTGIGIYGGSSPWIRQT